MKNSIKLFLLGSVLVSTAACTNLDVPVTSTYTEYPDSEIAKEAKMAGIYYKFGGALGRRYTEAAWLSSDEFMAVTYGGNWWDGGNYVKASRHESSADDAHVDWAGDIAGAITACNQVIVDLGGEKAKEEQIAPAVAMRAFYHFIFMDMFGATPILDHIPEATEAVDRSPRSKVAEFIENELKRAIQSGGLSTKVNAATYGKPTVWMAKALLAKLYLNWAVYTCDDVTTYTPDKANAKLEDCLNLCQDIIDSKEFNLNDDIRTKFGPNNGAEIKDFIYAMPYQNNQTANGANTYARFLMWSKFNDDGKGGVGLYKMSLGKNAGGIFVMTPECVDRFNLVGDRRNEMIIGGPLCYMDINTQEMGTEPYMYWDPSQDKFRQVVLTKDILMTNDQVDQGNDLAGWERGYHFNKFYIQPSDYNEYGRNQSNDVPIFRYADILLTKAEVLVRQGKAGNASEPFNQVRSCAMAPQFVGTLTLKDIIDERGRELCGELWRRNDLIRFGMFEDDWGYKHDAKCGRPDAQFELFRRIFPISTGMMKSNTNWKQNPGYKVD